MNERPSQQVPQTPAFEIDGEGRIQACSEAGAALLGRPPPALLGKTWAESGLPADLAAPLANLCSQAAQEGREQRLQLVVPAEKGPRLHDVVANPLWTEGGGRKVLLSLRPMGEAEEIYARALLLDKAARAEVEAAERRRVFLYQAMTTLFAHPPDPIGMFTLLAHLAVPDLCDWCVVDALEGERLSRIAIAHLDPGQAGLAAALPRHPRLHPDAAVGVSRVVCTGESELVPAITGSFLLSAGSEPDHAQLLQRVDACSYMVVPLRARGHVLGAVTFISAGSHRHYGPEDLALAEDLCQRASLAVDNARLFGEARRATSAREDVLAVVSHDLRNSLNVVQLGASLLLRRASPEQVTKQATRIQSSAKQMLRLVSDLLDWGRIESGHVELQREEVALEPVLVEAVEAIRPLAEAKHQRLELSIQGTPPRLSLDRARLLQVLGNLLGNAVKFTPEGGQITVGAQLRDGQVEIRVEDSGVGIPAAQLPYIFDRYWQARDLSRLGTGLGLGIAKGLVEAHGGRIRVASTEGMGTTFTFTVPLEGHAGQTDTPDEAPRPQLDIFDAH